MKAGISTSVLESVMADIIVTFGHSLLSNLSVLLHISKDNDIPLSANFSWRQQENP
jgi:hypothetical protein